MHARRAIASEHTAAAPLLRPLARGDRQRLMNCCACPPRCGYARWPASGARRAGQVCSGVVGVFGAGRRLRHIWSGCSGCSGLFRFVRGWSGCSGLVVGCGISGRGCFVWSGLFRFVRGWSGCSGLAGAAAYLVGGCSGCSGVFRFVRGWSGCSGLVVGCGISGRGKVLAGQGCSGLFGAGQGAPLRRGGWGEHWRSPVLSLEERRYHGVGRMRRGAASEVVWG